MRWVEEVLEIALRTPPIPLNDEEIEAESEEGKDELSEEKPKGKGKPKSTTVQTH